MLNDAVSAKSSLSESRS